MKAKKIVIICLLIAISASLSGQQTSHSWDKWKYLIGEWVGEGNGQPGQGEGSFSFQTNLEGKVLVRKNHTTFPETAKSAATVHDDLLYVYASPEDGSQEAIYFDNEGHVIRYRISFTESSIVLTSDKSPKSPRFRLTYSKLSDTSVNIIFAMAMPDAPDSFRTYLEGKANKIK